LIATSREPLGIDGEQIFRVPTLATPAPDDDLPAIRGSEAVRLLADRAARAGAPLLLDEQTAPVVGRISRRLDGIPLAIELAAARLRVMSVTELDARLDQRFSLLTGGSRAAPPRHQTLLATIDWSWELLTGVERDMLARLSVFVGGFDLAACEAVTVGADIMAGDAVALLAALVDKSLVQFDEAGSGPARYRLLEMVRQFAAQRLHDQDSAAADAVGACHRDHYLALAEAAAPKLIASDQGVWLDRLDAELGNLRAAIAFSLRHADPEPGLRLAASLRIFWSARGHAAEAADSLRALLDLPAVAEPGAARAQALAAAAKLVEQPAVADAYCVEAMRIAEARGDDHLVADIVAIRAFRLIRAGQNAAALPLVENALDLAHRLGDRHLTARLLYDRSYALDSEGDHAAAARDAAESLDLFRQLGDLRETGRVLSNLAYDEAGAGKLELARAHLAESLGIHRGLKDKYGVVYASLNLGIAEYLSGSPAAAGILFAESLQLARRLFLSEGVGYALLGLAMIRDAPEAADWSARLHGAADRALDTLGRTPQPLEAQLRDADRERLRAAMGAQAFEAGYAAGRALTLEEAIELALHRDSPVGGRASDALAADLA
jgi:predicted ATPase